MGRRDIRCDAFSKYHPAVNFLFFVGALVCAMVIQHPAYLLAGVWCGGCYYLLLYGARGRIWTMIPLFLFLAAVNPLFNRYGERVLFWYFDRPYTLEALLYGCAIAAIFIETILWLGCYNAVLTSDKFTSLFGNLIPAVSLLLVMVLRMIPNLLRKAKQISGARSSIGHGVSAQDSMKKKLTEGMTLLGALTSWALEGSVVTADSMRSRGYGSGKHTSFNRYTMNAADWLLLLAQETLLLAALLLGDTAATYTPMLSIAPVSGKAAVGLGAYVLYLLLPAILYIKEVIQWRISISKI